jgi:hypothetical protein
VIRPAWGSGLLLAGAVLTSALLTGCTQSSPGQATGSQSAVSTPATASAPAPTTAAPTPAPTPAPSTPTPSATSTAATPSPSASSLGAAVSSCTASQLSIDVTKGGASFGQEIAVVSFTNTSASTCSLSGYPSAVLQTSGGATVGKPALHLAGHITTVVLAPHKSAQADLTADTRCNAPESSAVRITAPGAPGSTEVPVALRACTLHITPLS